MLHATGCTLEEQLLHVVKETKDKLRFGSQHMAGCSSAQTLVTVSHSCDATLYLGVQTLSLWNQLSSQWLKILIPHFSDSYNAVVDQRSASL